MILLALSAENHAVAIDRAQVTLTNNIWSAHASFLVM
jgi:hypothetical protein